ncbi:hypothetical protein GGX14DRAFT_542457 [Mycena pura]|uniref:Uncharacterized protein n=1 Tax=Mycena pura TaxID=153505 RepID=A0AAD6YIQ7_9AGAR|nr:hypothetical protein GGX14DRAFT_542457 [Mycena pura]
MIRVRTLKTDKSDKNEAFHIGSRHIAKCATCYQLNECWRAYRDLDVLHAGKTSLALYAYVRRCKTYVKRLKTGAVALVLPSRRVFNHVPTRRRARSLGAAGARALSGSRCRRSATPHATVLQLRPRGSGAAAGASHRGRLWGFEFAREGKWEDIDLEGGAWTLAVGSWITWRGSRLGFRLALKESGALACGPAGCISGASSERCSRALRWAQQSSDAHAASRRSAADLRRRQRWCK